MQAAEQVLEEVEIDIGDLEFKIIDATSNSMSIEDTRTFVDKCFTDMSRTTGPVLKPIRKIQCVDNDEPEIHEDGEIALLLNYRSKKGRGRKVPLSGMNVLHVSCPSGDIRLPLDEVEDFAKYLVAVARAVKEESLD